MSISPQRQYMKNIINRMMIAQFNLEDVAKRLADSGLEDRAVYLRVLVNKIEALKVELKVQTKDGLAGALEQIQEPEQKEIFRKVERVF